MSRKTRAVQPPTGQGSRSLINDLESILSDVEGECQEFHRKNWPDYPYEHTVNAEFYHLLRVKGYQFGEIDTEKSIGENRIDLVRGADKDARLVAVQFIPYRVGLQKDQFDDAEALGKLPANVEKVLVLVRMGEHVRSDENYRHKIDARMDEVRKNGIHVVSS